MKVLCIDDLQCFGLIHVGEIYEAEQCPFPESYRIVGKEYYVYDGNRYRLNLFKKRFIPLSTIDETEMERNYKKQLV